MLEVHHVNVLEIYPGNMVGAEGEGPRRVSDADRGQQGGHGQAQTGEQRAR